MTYKIFFSYIQIFFIIYSEYNLNSFGVIFSMSLNALVKDELYLYPTDSPICKIVKSEFKRSSLLLSILHLFIYSLGDIPILFLNHSI